MLNPMRGLRKSDYYSWNSELYFFSMNRVSGSRFMPGCNRITCFRYVQPLGSRKSALDSSRILARTTNSMGLNDNCGVNLLKSTHSLRTFLDYLPQSRPDRTS